MTQIQKTLVATLMTLSMATVSLGGTITGSRTTRTGTITGSRTGTITGSRTGTITGSRTGTITGSRIAQGIIPAQSERGSKCSIQEELLSNLMIFLNSLAW
jgi:hypothetical protein